MLRSKLRGSLRCQIVVCAGCGALRVNFLGIRKLASASKAPNKQRVKANKMPSFEMRASEWGFCFIGMLFTRVLSQIRREVMRKMQKQPWITRLRIRATAGRQRMTWVGARQRRNLIH